MKYSLDIFLKTFNVGTIEGAKQHVPNIDDPRIWLGQYVFQDTVPDEDGIPAFSCMVRFNIESDRDAVVDLINNVDGMLYECSMDSYVRGLETWHDENIDNPPRGCEGTFIYEVVE